MRRRNILVGNLGAKLNDFRAPSEQRECLFGSPHSSGKGARQHDALTALSIDDMHHSEKPIFKFELGRFVDKQLHSTPLLLADSATEQVRGEQINAALTSVGLGDLSKDNLACLSHSAPIRRDDSAPVVPPVCLGL